MDGKSKRTIFKDKELAFNSKRLQPSIIICTMCYIQAVNVVYYQMRNKKRKQKC